MQCDSSDENFNLLSCTRHLLMDQRLKRTDMLTENQMVLNYASKGGGVIKKDNTFWGDQFNFIMSQQNSTEPPMR